MTLELLLSQCLHIVSHLHIVSQVASEPGGGGAGGGCPPLFLTDVKSQFVITWKIFYFTYTIDTLT